MRALPRLLTSILVAVAFLGGVSLSSSPFPEQTGLHPEDAQLLGTWQLDLARSKYMPGPPPVRETRTYTRDESGMAGRIERHFDDGRKEVIEYRADYDRDHLVYGSRTYDTLLLRRIAPYTAEAVLSHAGRLFGTARRVISPDGETMTITFRRTEPGDMINNVVVYRKVSK